MKKFVSFFLALMMLCSLAACDGLSLKPSEGPVDKDGYIGDTMSTYWFDFTVNGAWSFSEYDGYTAKPGYQLVIAEVTLKNTTNSSIDMWDTDFLILWDDPDENSGWEIPVPAYCKDQFPEEYTLGIKAKKTGLLIYEVPEDYRDFIIWFQEIYEDEDDPTNEDGIQGDSFFVYFTAEEP